VVPASRARQGAGISTGGTKIGVTGSETSASEQMQAIKQSAGNDLCHCCDRRAEVKGMTHYALPA
jgi:hypothetical protein